MAKKNFISFLTRICRAITNVGRWIGARRALFVWSAISFAIAAYVGVSGAIQSYAANYVIDMNAFVLAHMLNILLLFLRIFTPMMMLVVATKYIFDNNRRTDRGASETLRLCALAAGFVGLVVAAFYYLDAGHIIGDNVNAYCPVGTKCLFSWKILLLAGKAFLASGISTLITLLALRGVYSELSFMLSKKK